MLYIVNLFPFTHEHTTKASNRDSRNRAPFVSVACPNTDLSLSRARLSARACHLNQKPITYATFTYCAEWKLLHYAAVIPTESITQGNRYGSEMWEFVNKSQRFPRGRTKLEKKVALSTGANTSDEILLKKMAANAVSSHRHCP